METKVGPLVRFRRLPNGDGLPLPAYQTDGAAGMDLAAAERVSIAPGEVARVPTGFAVEIPQGFEGQIRGRSGLGSVGISIAQGVGTIDCDYRGEVVVLLANNGTGQLIIERGERMAQLVIAPVVQASVEEAAKLSDTARGNGGFGSTGK